MENFQFSLISLCTFSANLHYRSLEIIYKNEINTNIILNDEIYEEKKKRKNQVPLLIII